MAPVEDEEATAQRYAEGADDEEEEDEDDEEVEEADASTEDQFTAYEGRLRTTVAKRLTAYRQKLEASVKERLETRRATLDEYVQSKLDEWTLKHAGTENIRNPERVTETLVRQATAAEERINSIRQQLAQLEESGVDVSAIREKLSAA